MSDEADRHREFVLLALRAAAIRAKAMEADLTTIGVALKGNMIDAETAVRWVKEAGLLWILDRLPEEIGKMS